MPFDRAPTGQRNALGILTRTRLDLRSAGFAPTIRAATPETTAAGSGRSPSRSASATLARLQDQLAARQADLDAIVAKQATAMTDVGIGVTRFP